jgi:hypothetical protein
MESTMHEPTMQSPVTIHQTIAGYLQTEPAILVLSPSL